MPTHSEPSAQRNTKRSDSSSLGSLSGEAFAAMLLPGRRTGPARFMTGMWHTEVDGTVLAPERSDS